MSASWRSITAAVARWNWRSTPAPILIWLSGAVAAVAFALPYLPSEALLGLAPLPPVLLGTLVLIVVGYLFASEALKQVFAARPMAWSGRVRPGQGRPDRHRRAA